MLDLPDGYTVGSSKRNQKEMHYRMLGDEWQVVVDYKGRPAFELAKMFDIRSYAPKYAGRIFGGKWTQFSHYTEAARVMAAKHRLGVKG
jgi:hypothetical protein